MSQEWTVERIEDLPRRSIFAGVEFRHVAGVRTSIAEAWFTKGTVIPSRTEPSHTHDSEELVYVIDGALRFRVGANLDEVIVRAGDVIVIPSNVPHGADAVEDTHAIAIYSPGRAEFSSAKEI